MFKSMYSWNRGLSSVMENKTTTACHLLLKSVTSVVSHCCGTASHFSARIYSHYVCLCWSLWKEEHTQALIWQVFAKVQTTLRAFHSLHSQTPEVVSDESRSVRTELSSKTGDVGFPLAAESYLISLRWVCFLSLFFPVREMLPHTITPPLPEAVWLWQRDIFMSAGNIL